MFCSRTYTEHPGNHIYCPSQHQNSRSKSRRKDHRKADKNRKIYNGMMKTYYYQFLGPRPPKKGSIKE